MRYLFLYTTLHVITFSFSNEYVKLISKFFKKDLISGLNVSDMTIDCNDDSDEKDECSKIKFNTFSVKTQKNIVVNTIHNFTRYSETTTICDYFFSSDFPPELL
jgi:hypothetical protein